MTLYSISRKDTEMARVRRDLYERLRQLANREGRSIAAQLSVILERALDDADATRPAIEKDPPVAA